MEIRVDKLRDTLKLLSPVIPKKTALPVLKNVLFKDGKAIATDLETTAILDLPEACEECLIPVTEVSELLKYVPGNEKLTIETIGKSLRLSWKNGKAAYQVAKAIDYPSAIPSDSLISEQEIDGSILIKTLVSMVGYAATEDSRPVLTGVSLYLGDEVTAAAGDGFRMVYQPLSLSFGKDGTAIIPAKSIPILSTIWEKTPLVAPLSDSLIHQITAKRKIRLSMGGKDNIPAWMAFEFGPVKVIIELIAGNPPVFKALIPVPVKKVQVMAPELERAVLRLKDIAKEGAGIIRLSWTETELTVSAKSEDTGESEATIPVNGQDGAGRFGINATYLAEYLKGKDGVVTFGITTESAPILFQYPDFPITVIMPMMVQW